jgi:hypothetical protein
MEQDYSERYSEPYSDSYRAPRSETEVLIERLDKLTMTLEKQHENHDRLMSLLERQMTVIERLLLR